MSNKATLKPFRSPRKPRLATPSGVRSEMGKAWFAYLRGEIEIDECKGAFYCLSLLGRLMVGPELEHQLHEFNKELAEFEQSRRSNGDGRHAARR